MNNPNIILAPRGNETTIREGRATIETPIVIFTATTSSKSDLLPTCFCGSMIRIKPVGGDLHFFFATATATVDNTAAAADAGNVGATVGWYLADGEWEDIMIPPGTWYFVRQASATTSVYIRQS
jgi:hypothetical protein